MFVGTCSWKCGCKYANPLVIICFIFRWFYIKSIMSNKFPH